MLSKAAFKNRFVDRMGRLVGQYEAYFEFAAKAAWENYKEDPDDMTPEDHADEDYSEWGR